MILFPTIELLNGQCVSLKSGRLDEPMVWHVDPVKTAQSFAQAGASWMQVTDFDALQGNDQNQEVLEEIIRSSGLSVAIGGGFHTEERVEHWIDKGAGRVVLGTLAAKDPAMAKRLAQRFPDQIALAVDVWQGQIMVDGWKSVGALTPEAFVKAFEDDPLAAMIVTDIDSDLAEADASLSLVTALAQTARAPVVASGIVRTIDDVSRLALVPGVAGAIVGRALFNKTIDLEEALTVATEPQGLAPEFI